MKNLLLSLLLLLAFTTEALADRGRLNRFGTLTVDTVKATGGNTAFTIDSNSVDLQDYKLVGGGTLGDLVLEAGLDDILIQAVDDVEIGGNGSGDLVVIKPEGSTVATFSSTGIGNNVVGSAAAPSWFFSGDTDTGLYRIGANSLGVTTGGIFRAQFTPSGFAAVNEIRNITSGGAIVLRSPDGSYSLCTVDNLDILSCTAE